MVITMLKFFYLHQNTVTLHVLFLKHYKSLHISLRGIFKLILAFFNRFYDFCFRMARYEYEVRRSWNKNVCISILHLSLSYIKYLETGVWATYAIKEACYDLCLLTHMPLAFYEIIFHKIWNLGENHFL